MDRMKDAISAKSTPGNSGVDKAENRKSRRPTAQELRARAAGKQTNKNDGYVKDGANGVKGNESAEKVSEGNSINTVLGELRGMQRLMEINKDEIKKEIDMLRDFITDRDKKWKEKKEKIFGCIEKLEERIQVLEEEKQQQGHQEPDNNTEEKERWE